VSDPYDPVEWDAGPEDPSGPFVPIYSPKRGQVVRVLAANDHILWVPTHYVDGHTAPHLKRVQTCPGCLQGQSIRRKGYLGAWDDVHSRYVLAELTLNAWRSGLDSLPSAETPLSGWRLILRRVGRAANGAVYAQWEPPLPAPTPLAPLDVQDALRRIWGYHRRSWGGIVSPPEDDGPASLIV
jgi:hypothetical protein